MHHESETSIQRPNKRALVEYGDLLKGREVGAQSKFYGQATKGMRVDALARVGEEGRGQLR